MRNAIFPLVFICLGSCNDNLAITAKPIDISQAVVNTGIDPEASTLLIVRLSDNQEWVSNVDRLDSRYSPASTSKIPHTLIGLETGVVRPDSKFIWDGQERAFNSWNEDQTLFSAYQRSAVWVYQDIVRKIGSEEIGSWLKEFQYGNYNVGTDKELTTYWLSEPLKLSAQEQVTFLKRLTLKTLPLSNETYQTAFTIFEDEKSDSTVLYSKTGWMHNENRTDIGWFVGWLENHKKGETYIFAFNMDMNDASLRSKRKGVVINALKAVGAWPEKEH